MARNSLSNSPTYLRGLLSLLVLVVLWLVPYLEKRRQARMNTINEIGKQVYLYLLELGFSLNMARFITAQAAHETGNFNSTIFKENNNLFGMKLPAIRQTTATGEKRGHATYNTIEDSIKDFKIYYEVRKYLFNYSSIDTYVKDLKAKNYFEASEQDYKEGVKHFYNLYFT